MPPAFFSFFYFCIPKGLEQYVRHTVKVKKHVFIQVISGSKGGQLHGGRTWKRS